MLCYSTDKKKKKMKSKLRIEGSKDSPFFTMDYYSDLGWKILSIVTAALANVFSQQTKDYL